MSTSDTAAARDAAFEEEPANSESNYVSVYEGTTDILLKQAGTIWVRYEDNQHLGNARAEVSIYRRSDNSESTVFPPLAYYSVSVNDALVYRFGAGRQNFRIGWGYAERGDEGA